MQNPSKLWFSSFAFLLLFLCSVTGATPPFSIEKTFLHSISILQEREPIELFEAPRSWYPDLKSYLVSITWKKGKRSTLTDQAQERRIKYLAGLITELKGFPDLKSCGWANFWLGYLLAYDALFRAAPGANIPAEVLTEVHQYWELAKSEGYLPGFSTLAFDGQSDAFEIMYSTSPASKKTRNRFRQKITADKKPPAWEQANKLLKVQHKKAAALWAALHPEQKTPTSFFQAWLKSADQVKSPQEIKNALAMLTREGVDDGLKTVFLSRATQQLWSRTTELVSIPPDLALTPAALAERPLPGYTLFLEPLCRPDPLTQAKKLFIKSPTEAFKFVDQCLDFPDDLLKWGKNLVQEGRWDQAELLYLHVISALIATEVPFYLLFMNELFGLYLKSFETAKAYSILKAMADFSEQRLIYEKGNLILDQTRLLETEPYQSLIATQPELTATSPTAELLLSLYRGAVVQDNYPLAYLCQVKSFDMTRADNTRPDLALRTVQVMLEMLFMDLVGFNPRTDSAESLHWRRIFEGLQVMREGLKAGKDYAEEP